MLTKWIGTLLAVVAASASPAPRAPFPAGAPTTDDVLKFEAGKDGVPLEQFVEQASAILDAPIFFVRAEMAGRVVHFDGKVEVPRAKFLGFFEQHLLAKRFVHLERTFGTIHSHAVTLLDTKRKRNLSLATAVRRVDHDQLAAMSDRQSPVVMAWYCTTTPAEQVVAKIRDRFDEAKLEEVEPVVGTNAIVIHAFAVNLAALVGTLEALGAHPATRKVVPLYSDRVAAPNDAPVVLRREPAGLRLSRVVDSVQQLVEEPIFHDGRPDHPAYDRAEWIKVELQNSRVGRAARVEDGRVDFAGEIRVDRANALAWLDVILAATSLARQRRTIAALPVEVLSNRVHSPIRDEARWIAPDQLAACAGEFVSTADTLGRLSAGQVVDSISGRFGHGIGDGVRAIEGSNAFVMTGAADKLATYVALAHELDAAATIDAATIDAARSADPASDK